MRSIILGFALFFVFALPGRGQEVRPFPTLGKTMPVGAYYYPEHWKREQWGRDLARMASLGFTFTHFAEFAWAQLEPAETPDGKPRYDFAWLDTAVAMAARHGLKVVMCTPSAIPPVWMQRKHPEMMVQNKAGRALEPGNRLHAAKASPIYRAAVARIVAAMAEHYGNNPTIIGWQLDNEPHVAGFYDYGPASQAGFVAWCKRKYPTLDSANQAWGTAFWSQTYTAWDQVRIPNRELGDVSPHQLLDYQLYTAYETGEALSEQAAILRAKVGPTQFVTTNYAYPKFLPEVNPFLTRAGLDFASYTMYPLSTYLSTEGGPLAYRYGSGLEMSYAHDLMRSAGRGRTRTGIMELQPGQINWGSYNALPPPGTVRMWLWHNYAMGADFVCTYRFRQPLYGGEHYHKGIMEPDGVTVSPGGKEFSAFIKEIEGLPKDADLLKERRRTALLWKQQNLLSQAVEPHTRSFDGWAQLYHAYAALKAAGQEVDMLTEADSLDVAAYPVAIAPSYEIAGPAQVARWERYVRAGGQLIITCRSAQKDEHGHLHQARFGQMLTPLTGVEITAIDQLPPGTKGAIEGPAGKFSFSAWGELLKPVAEGVETLATYREQWYAGSPAITRRRLGAGTVMYLGFTSEDGSAERELSHQALAAQKLPPLRLPPYVFVERRAGLHIAVNYSSKPYELGLTAKQIKPRIGKSLLAPGTVTVW